jgi:hypothetical protein
VKRFVLIALLLSMSGCSERATEVIVVVNKYGITVGPGNDVEEVQIIVRNDPKALPIYSTDRLPLCPGLKQSGCWTTPVTATLVPGPHNMDAPVVVQVYGLRNGQPVIGDQATFQFLHGQSQRLDFVLYASCLNHDCTAENKVCNFNGQCESMMPTPFNGGLDGIPPNLIPDLGAGNSDMSASVDMGRAKDLSVNMPPEDMSVPIDMAMVRDMSAAAVIHDMVVIHDLAKHD